MKNSKLILVLLLVSILSFSCKKENEIRITQQETSTYTSSEKHLPEANTLAGIWKQVFIDAEGKEHFKPFFKVIDSDGTFYLIWDLKPKSQAFIGLYGTYTIDSDSTYTEYIKKQVVNEKLNNTKSNLRYKLLDNNNTLLLEFHIEGTDGVGREIWKRVKPTMPGYFKPINKKNNTVEV